MKKKSPGFTIVELLLAIGLSTIVIGVSTMIMHNLFAENKSMELWSSGQIETSMALKAIEGDIRNVIRMDPKENLVNNQDIIYVGLSPLASGQQPSLCLNTNGASVVRYTTLIRNQRSEQVLRAWSESDDANKTGVTHELRVSADATTNSMFGAQKNPIEIVLVDADRRYLRRYQVASYMMKLNSNLDPYDDQPKVDSFGKPIVFKYASVFLKSPNTADNKLIDLKTANFITGSEVYAARTYVVCIRKSDRSLIRYDETTKEERVLLQNPHPDFTLDSFRVGYMGTQKGIRVEPESFIPDALSMPNFECMNTVLFTINLNGSESLIRRSESQAVGEVKRSISRQRAVYSHNLSVKRPLSCD